MDDKKVNVEQNLSIRKHSQGWWNVNLMYMAWQGMSALEHDVAMKYYITHFL